MNDELLPCPFCGAPAASGGDEHEWQVACSRDCDATPCASKPTREEAEAIWNRRTASRAAMGEVDDSRNLHRKEVDEIMNLHKDPNASVWADAVDEAARVLCNIGGHELQPLYDLSHALRTAPPSAGLGGEWRTMESAPDKTRILAYWPDANGPSIETVDWDAAYYASVDDCPTHWQPIPPPPAADDRGV